jgi:threonine dehydrogenase-like Zn-dependent dehydrogenase
VNEITLIGSRCGHFSKAIQLLTTKKLVLSPLIDAIYSLNEANLAFSQAAQSSLSKVLFNNTLDSF